MPTTEHQVLKIAEFIADAGPTIPYLLIEFRPNFILYYHPDRYGSDERSG
ncbi:MAG: hypothetical protein ACXQS5_00935 [Candidatus Methanospirareceae archaeon]